MNKVYRSASHAPVSGIILYRVPFGIPATERCSWLLFMGRRDVYANRFRKWKEKRIP